MVGMILPAEASRGHAFLHARRSFPTHAATSAMDRSAPVQVIRRMCRYLTKRRETVEQLDDLILDEPPTIVAATMVG